MAATLERAVLPPENVRAFITALNKSLSQMSVRHSAAPELVEPAWAALAPLLSDKASVALKVEPNSFTHGGVHVSGDAEALAERLFKEGLRQLTFRAGFGQQQLVGLCEALLADPARSGEDSVAILWRLQLPHFGYQVTEGVRLEDGPKAQAEVDKLADQLAARLRASSGPTRFTSPQHDLQPAVATNGAVHGCAPSEALRKALRQELDKDRNERLFPELVNAIFQLLDSGACEPVLLQELFVDLLDTLLRKEDFAAVHKVMAKLKALADRKLGDEGLGSLLRVFIAKLGEPERLRRLAGPLDFPSSPHVPAIAKCLGFLSLQAVPALLSILETVENQDGRALLRQVLVPFAKENPHPFAAALGTERPETVRDMALILDKSRHPERFKMFSVALKDKPEPARLEILRVLAAASSIDGLRLLQQALENDRSAVRLTAALLLIRTHRDLAYAYLAKAVRAPDFERLTFDERVAHYAALGQTGHPEVYPVCEGLLSQRAGLLNRGKVAEGQLLAIAALGALKLPAAIDKLRALAASSGPEGLTTAAKRALADAEALPLERAS